MSAAILAVTKEMRERKVNGKAISPTLVAWADRIDAELAAIAELVEANRELIASAPPHMCPRNARERDAYRRIRTAITSIGGTK